MRWYVIVWVFIIAAVSYLDRNNLSIAASFIQSEYGFSNIQLGAIFSAFVAGYAFSQPLAGYIADKFGAYRSIAAGIFWWTIFTTLTPLVPVGMAGSLAMLLAVRFLLGIGEAVIFPASNRLVATWIPTRERGLANGIIFSGVGVGGGVAPPLITYLILSHSWRWAFYTCALVGVVAGICWLTVARDRPQDHKRVTPQELAYIEAGIPPHAQSVHHARWRDILRDRQAILLTSSYFCFGYVAYIFFTWFFKYLSDVRGLNLRSSAIYAMLPFVAMALASSLGGALSDAIVKRFGKWAGRCGVASVALFATSIFVWSATQVDDARLAALILAGGAGALYLAQSAFWAVSADIAGGAAGRLSSIMNMGCQTGGLVTASLTPIIADKFGWSMSFTAAAALCIVGAAAWIFVDPSHVLQIRSPAVVDGGAAPSKATT